MMAKCPTLWRRRQQMGQQLLEAAQNCCQQRQQADALAYQAAALQIFQGQQDCYYQSQALQEIGKTFQQLDQQQQAIDCRKMAVQVATQLDDRQRLLQALQANPVATQRPGSDPYYAGYCQLLRLSTYRHCDARCCAAIREIIGICSPSSENAAVLRAASAAFIALGNTLLATGTAQWNDAVLCSRQWNDALDRLRQAYAKSIALDSSYVYGNIFLSLGQWRCKAGTYRRAIGPYQQAIAIFTASNQHHCAAITHLNLGAARCKSGAYRQAIAAYQRAVNGFQQLADHHQTAIACQQLAQAHLESGNYREAIAWHNKSWQFPGQRIKSRPRWIFHYLCFALRALLLRGQVALHRWKRLLEKQCFKSRSSHRSGGEKSTPSAGKALWQQRSGRAARR